MRTGRWSGGGPTSHQHEHRPSPAWLPAIAGGFYRLNQSGMNFLIPLWALHIGATTAQIGVLAAAGAVALVFFSIPLGAANDRFGARRIMMLSFSGAALTGVLYGFCHTFISLLVLQLFAGMSRQSAWIGSQGYVTSGPRAAAADRELGFFGAMANIAAPLGPLVAGWLGSQGSYPLAFWVMASVSAAGAVCSYLLPDVTPPARPRAAAADRPAVGEKDFLRALALLRQPHMRLVVFCSFLRLFIVQTRATFVPVLLKDGGFADQTIGLLVAVGSLAGALAATLVPLLTRYVRREPLLPLVLGTAAVATGCLALLTTPVGIGALLVIQGGGVGLGLPLLMGGVAAATRPEDRGLGAGLRSTVNRSAQLVSPTALGLLAGWLSLPVAFAAGGAAMVVLAAFGLSYGRRLARMAATAAATAATAAGPRSAT